MNETNQDTFYLVTYIVPPESRPEIEKDVEVSNKTENSILNVKGEEGKKKTNQKIEENSREVERIPPVANEEDIYFDKIRKIYSLERKTKR